MPGNERFHGRQCPTAICRYNICPFVHHFAHQHDVTELSLQAHIVTFGNDGMCSEASSGKDRQYVGACKEGENGIRLDLFQFRSQPVVSPSPAKNESHWTEQTPHHIPEKSRAKND